MNEYGPIIAIVLVVFIISYGGFFFSKQLLKEGKTEPVEIIINESIVEPLILEEI